MTIFEKPACPECGSHDVVPIIYGLPGPELETRAVMGEVMLGGCVVFDSAPDLYCKSCSASWRDMRAKRHLVDPEAGDTGSV